MEDITSKIKEICLSIGFDKAGIVDTGGIERDFLQEWLSAGLHAGMVYMQKDIEKRLSPQKYIPWARSVICVAKNYYIDLPDRSAALSVRISRYAMQRDYHEVIADKLKILCEFIEKDLGGRTKICVDTSPVMEKVLATRAGLGWIGKNTLLITRGYGPWVFLGEVFTDLELAPDEPFEKDYCGRCTRCLDMCPTKALIRPYVLDAGRCISYLTIEHKGDIPVELQSLMGNWAFGCDICLEVCPWSRFARDCKAGMHIPLDINFLSSISEQDFEEIFAHTPILRIGYQRFMRNLEIALRNVRCK